ncbi:MAG: aldehyde ferredoxin oxidoreductase C-terminal domain-containing protein [Candidatus Helarchaeota archaeon]
MNYNQYIIRIDLEKEDIKMEEIKEDHPFEFYAARSLSSKIIAEEVPPKCDPLGKENKLIFATGFLSGTIVPNSGRISIGAKSPLTEGIKESNVGGRAPSFLAQQKIRAIILENISNNWKIIEVKDSKLKLLDAEKFGYNGMNNIELSEHILKDFNHRVGAFTIGIAGEKKFLNASIASLDMEGYPSRHAGRGGMGAVMGSKKIKAIIVHPPSKISFDYYDKNTFQSIAKDWFKELSESKKIFSKYGTALGVSGMNQTHGLPTQNFRRGSFKDVEGINADALHNFIIKNNGKYSVPCSPGCAIKCSNILYDENGQHITSSLEYETIGLNASNLMIGNIEYIAKIDRYYEDLGIDTIEGGNTFAMLMEAGKLKWGDWQGIIKIFEGIKNNDPECLDIGLGCYRLGKKLGVKRIPHVKKQGLPAYDPRSYKAMGVTYYTSPMGADHTAGPAIINRKAYGNFDYKADQPWNPEYKVKLSKDLQIFIMIMDSMGLCYFVGPSYENTLRVADLLKARYGLRWNKSAEDWIHWAKKCLLMERDFNLRAGISESEDKLPEFIEKEPLQDIDRYWDIDEQKLKDFWKS